jgi:hypothetical protein
MCGSRPSRRFSSCHHRLLLLSPTPLSVWSLTPSLPAQCSYTRPRQCPPCRALHAPLDGARHSPTWPPGPPTSCRAIPIRGRCALLAAACATRPSSPTSAPIGLSCHRLGPHPHQLLSYHRQCPLLCWAPQPLGLPSMCHRSSPSWCLSQRCSLRRPYSFPRAGCALALLQ